MYTRSLILSFISLLTLFTVNIAQANTEIPDYYDEPGYSQVRQSGQELLGDNVDPFSGQLTIAHTDLFLPGNGGLDLSIVRSYSSYRAGKPALNTGRSSMGQGWDMHMGRIYFDGFLNTQFCPLHLLEATSEENPVLELPDGSKKVFYADGNRFMTKDFWRGECIDHSYIESGRTYEDGGMLVTSPDGVVYRFDRRALTPVNKVAYVVTSITDARGNRITINYRAKPVNTNGGSILDNWRDGITNDANGLTYFAVIDRITTSDGRQVNFSYFLSNTYSETNRGLPVIRQISTTGRSVTYSYNDTPDFLYLDQVHQSDGGSWGFDYYPFRFPICSLNCQEASVEIASSNKIRRIISPLDASVRYEYIFIPSGTRNGVIGAVANRQISSSGGDGTWRYSYNLGSNYDETTITTPVSTEVYRHFGSLAAADGSVWRIGTLLYKSISGGGAFQTETYEWDSILLSDQDEKRLTRSRLRDNDIRIPIMVSKSIVRDGTAFTTTYRDHNSYGVPTRITERGGAVLEENIGETDGFSPINPYTVTNTKNISLSYEHYVNRWILNLPTRESVSGTFNTAPRNGEQNWNGEVIRAYYSNGLLRRETANNITTQYTYTPSGDIESVTDANNHRTTYSDYDRGIPQEELKPNGIRLSREVDNLGRVTSETDGRGNTKTFTYDGMGRLRSITPPEKASISIEWPSHTTRVLTRGGFTERRRYDSQGYEQSRTVEGEEAITYTKDYDVMGRLLFESYPNSTDGISYRYDALNRIVRREEPGGKIQTYNYKGSNRVDVTDGLNNTVEYFYRSFGSPDEKELIGTVEPEGTITQIRRDITGNIVRLNQNGIERTFTYDPRKFLLSEDNPEKGQVEYRHDNVGNVIAMRQDGENPKITIYRYDEINRLERIDYPYLTYINGDRVYLDSLNAPDLPDVPPPSDPSIPPDSSDQPPIRGSVISTTDTSGGGIIHSPFAPNNSPAPNPVYSLPGIIVVDELSGDDWQSGFPDAASLFNCDTLPCMINIKAYSDVFAYDDNDNLISASRNLIDRSSNFDVSSSFVTNEVETEAQWSYGYDLNNNLVSEIYSHTGDASYEFAYDYNSQDALSSITYPSMLVVDYQPDNYGRPTQVGSFAHNILYHPTGSIDSLTYSNGVTTTIELNERLNVDVIDYGTVGRLAYTFNAVDNITQITDTVNFSANKNLEYDNQYRLISASGSWGDASYTYDEHNNITFKNISGISTNYDYDSQNRLSGYSSSGVFNQVAYDIYGNVTSNGQSNFGYDNKGNLISAAGTLSYQYDANNRRVKESSIDGSRFTFYSQSGKLLYEKDDVRKVNAEYIYLSDKLIAKRNLEEGVLISSPVNNSIFDIEEGETSIAVTLTARAFDSSGSDISADLVWTSSLITEPLATGASVNVDFDIVGGHVITASVISGGTEYSASRTIEITSTTDTDGDGLTDYYESSHGLNPNDASDALLDADNDGLNNLEEYQAGTNINSADTDGDLLTDAWEIANGLDPLVDQGSDDIDGDGFSTFGEYIAATSPTDPLTYPGYDGDIIFNSFAKYYQQIRGFGVGGAAHTYSEDGRFIIYTDKIELSPPNPSNYLLHIAAVDINSRTQESVGYGVHHAVSANGQFIIYRGRPLPSPGEPAIVPGYTNNWYLHNLTTGTDTELSFLDGSTDVEMTADAHYIVFTSNVADLTESTPEIQGSYVYRYNRLTQEVELVSQLAVPASDPSIVNLNGIYAFEPRVSADGRYVLFKSSEPQAFSLGANPRFTQLFLRDMEEGQTYMVSKNSTSDEGAHNTDISEYGFLVDGSAQVYYSGGFRVSELVDRLSYIAQPSRPSIIDQREVCGQGEVSGDGICLPYENTFIYDLASQSNDILCVNDSGGPVDHSCIGKFSKNGEVAYIESHATNIQGNPQPSVSAKLYVKNLQTNVIDLLPNGRYVLDISYDGDLALIAAYSHTSIQPYEYYPAIYNRRTRNYSKALSVRASVVGLSPAEDSLIMVIPDSRFGSHYIADIEINFGTDSDNDGYPDNVDAYPNDPNESRDTDGDGVGDNADAFPVDPTETVDSDGDGVGDNSDAFPDNPAETADSDGDGIGDNADPTPNGDNVSPQSIVIGLDFGAAIFGEEGAGWNAVTGETSAIADLTDMQGLSTGVTLDFIEPFSGISFEGSTSNLAPYPAGVSGDFLLSSGENAQVSFRVSGLNPALLYRFNFYGSNTNASGNYETIYSVTGSGKESVTLNMTENVSTLAVIDAFSANASGEVTVTLQAGPANTTLGNVFGINALVIETAAGPNENTSPVVANVIPDQSVTENTPFEYRIPENTFSDIDGDSLSLTVSGLPVWMSFDSGTQTLTGMATPAGATTLMVTATDGNGGSVSDSFVVTVVAAVIDTDGDGVPDSLDAFPNDPTETVDSDGDGVGDNADAFPNDATETVDTDGDGVGDNADPYPNDPLNRETFTLIDHFTTTEVSPMTYQLQLPDGEPVEETVSLYRDLNGVVENADGSITKATPDSWWGSGVFDSLATLAAGSDGWIEFSPTDTTTTMAIGWSAADMAENYGAAEIQYRLWLEGGVVQVFEGTEWRETLGVYQPGDTLRIERQSSTIVYRLNGIELYSSTVPSLDALRLEGFIYDQNATIPRPTYSFEGNTGGGIDFLPEILPGLGGALSYRDLNGVLANADGSITKTTPDSWWGSGVFDSEETLAANTDGWVEFTVTSLSSSLALGLAPADMADNFGPADITYRIFVEDGAASVYEGMNWVEGLGSLAVGDTLRIERQGSSIIYWLNGVVSYTSTLSSTEALRAEGFIYNQGASIAGIEASFGAVTEPPQESYFYTIRAGDSWPIVASLLYSSEGVIDELQSELGSTLPQVGDDLGALPETIIDDEHTITVESHYPLTSAMTWSDIAGVLYGSTAAANELEAIMTTAGYNLATSDRLLEADLPPSITVTQ